VILAIGTVCMDRVRRVPSLPAAGGYVEIEDELRLLGGEAANTANALSAWGDAVVLAGNPLGISEEATLLRESLANRGLPLLEMAKAVDLVSTVTPVCDIYVTPDGDRTMFGRGFSSLEQHLDLGPMPWKGADWFTAEPNMELASREAVRQARSNGLSCYLMDFIRADDPIYAGSFWQSSTDWAGHRHNVQRNVRWVKEWVERYGCFAILSDGPNGFVAGSAEVAVRAFPPFPAPVLVDTTGAGDLFRAGMLHGLDRGWEIADCLRFGSAAGCLKCRSFGATVDVPTVAEIERHIAENGEVSRQYSNGGGRSQV